MYTGFPSAPPPPKRNRFGAVIVLGIALMFLLSCAVFVLLADIAGNDETFLQSWDGGILAENTPKPMPSVSPGSTPEIVISSAPGDLSAPVAEGVLSASQIFKKVAPSVVGIISKDRSGREAGVGTGVIISSDGYICTNQHVVADASQVVVAFENGEEYEAVIIGQDYLSDVAVIKIDETNLTPAEFGDSEQLVPGDAAYAIGNPLGLELQNTITNGIISAVNRDISIEDSYGTVNLSVLQTNCAVNPGNSGGPLCNQYGQMVGIISSKIMGDYFSTVEGLAFAIPMATVKPIVQELMSVGYVQGRPSIGITANTSIQLDKFTAQIYGVPVGVVVDSVDERSDAYKKGVASEDIITHVNGQEVSTVGEINIIKNKFKAGDSITLTIYRDGRSFDLDILLMDSKELE